MEDLYKSLETIVDKARKYDALVARGKKLELTCSFCGADENSVKKLIAGGKPSVYICDQCVYMCLDVLNQDALTND